MFDRGIEGRGVETGVERGNSVFFHFQVCTASSNYIKVKLPIHSRVASK